MSEYYKKIGFTLFQKNGIAGALQHHVLFISQENDRRIIQEVNNKCKSIVMNAKNVDLAKLPKDVLGTSLIPDIDNKPGHRIEFQARENGNCLYHSTSLSLCGDESQSTALHLLVVSELYFNAKYMYYVTHKAFKRAQGDSRICVISGCFGLTGSNMESVLL